MNPEGDNNGDIGVKSSSHLSTLRNTIYYNVKPFVPPSWRGGIRRLVAQRQRRRFAKVWPIMPGSERPPKGWAGWPEGKKFAVVLTHDIEGPAGLKTCCSLMQLESDLGFCSSFNFIPEGGYAVPAALRNELEQNQFEVGVHDLRHDGKLFRSLSRFNASVPRINHYLHEWNAVGFRAGFMFHNLDWLHRLNIQYDLSTFDTDPFEPQPEGRRTIFPFWVAPPLESESTEWEKGLNGYVELPYTLPQDSTLFFLLREQTIDIWTQKLDWIAEHGGMVLMDTHPDYMHFGCSNRTSETYPVRFYLELLEHLRSRYEGQFWHALPRDVAAHVSKTRTSLEPLSSQQELAPFATHLLDSEELGSAAH